MYGHGGRLGEDRLMGVRMGAEGALGGAHRDGQAESGSTPRVAASSAPASWVIRFDSSVVGRSTSGSSVRQALSSASTGSGPGPDAAVTSTG